jgi:hypothetical protein
MGWVNIILTNVEEPWVIKTFTVFFASLQYQAQVYLMNGPLQLHQLHVRLEFSGFSWNTIGK